jgi:hypothetical protein
MLHRAPLCSGSLSRGSALTRIVISVVAAVVLFFAVRGCFPSREEKLLRFLDESRTELTEGREDDFFEGVSPDVTYREKGGLAEMRNDWKRYRASGIGAPNVVKQEWTLDDTGATVRMEVVFVAGLRPIAQVGVTIRLADGDGAWKVTSLGWK